MYLDIYNLLCGSVHTIFSNELYRVEGYKVIWKEIVWLNFNKTFRNCKLNIFQLNSVVFGNI